MTREEFEIKLIEDLVKGIDDIYDYIHDNLEVLQKNKDYFREYFLNNPYYAYFYAKYVDKGPMEDTRKAACKDPEYAYYYAVYVDKGPRDDTRKAACRDSENAYYYARFVDECPRDDTFKAVKGTDWEEEYIEDIGSPNND